MPKAVNMRRENNSVRKVGDEEGERIIRKRDDKNGLKNHSREGRLYRERGTSNKGHNLSRRGNQ